MEWLEIATLGLARQVGLRAPDARLELKGSDHPVALIRRFDHRAGGRVPYISARPSDDLREIWLRTVFGILVTNTDDHLKHHGFIYAGNNVWRISPIFDVNPQPRHHPQMETVISPIHGHETDIGAAHRCCPVLRSRACGGRQACLGDGRRLFRRLA